MMAVNGSKLFIRLIRLRRVLVNGPAPFNFRMGGVE